MSCIKLRRERNGVPILHVWYDQINERNSFILDRCNGKHRCECPVALLFDPQSNPSTHSNSDPTPTYPTSIHPLSSVRVCRFMKMNKKTILQELKPLFDLEDEGQGHNIVYH